MRISLLGFGFWLQRGRIQGMLLPGCPLRCSPVALLVLICTTGTACGATGPSLDPDRAEAEVDLPAASGSRYGSYLSYEHAIRAELLWTRGDLEDAAAEFKLALVNDPDDFFLRANLASVLIALGRYDDARRQVRRAIAAEPTAEYAWIALAELHLAEGDRERAVGAARRAIRVEPRRHEAALWLAAQLRQQGENSRAVEIYQRVVTADPANAAAHLGLGEVSLSQGNLEAAQRHLADYLELGYADPAVIAELATVHLEDGNPGRAIGLLELAVSLATKDIALRELLIVLMLDEGLHQRALRHLRSLPRITDGEGEAAIRRACWLMRAGRPYLARDLIVDNFGASPTKSDLRLALAAIEIRLGRIEIAAALLELPCNGCSAAELTGRRALVDDLQRWPAVPKPCGAQER